MSAKFVENLNALCDVPANVAERKLLGEGLGFFIEQGAFNEADEFFRKYNNLEFRTDHLYSVGLHFF